MFDFSLKHIMFSYYNEMYVINKVQKFQMKNSFFSNIELMAKRKLLHEIPQKTVYNANNIKNK